jgi:hypothetical protein
MATRELRNVVDRIANSEMGISHGDCKAYPSEEGEVQQVIANEASFFWCN